MLAGVKDLGFNALGSLCRDCLRVLIRVSQRTDLGSVDELKNFDRIEIT